MDAELSYNKIVGKLAFQVLRKQVVPWTVAYKLPLLIPDIMLMQNSNCDSWFYSTKDGNVLRRKSQTVNYKSARLYF